MTPLRIKICGITQPDQGRAIAQAGATALGFICTTKSPRYVTPAQIQAIGQALPGGTPAQPPVARIGVFVQASIAEIQHAVAVGQLSGVQLHGGESLEFCQAVRAALPSVELIKAWRIRTPADLAAIAPYEPIIDTILLDAYHPEQWGGTGQTLDWQALQTFYPQRPWLLAGGLTPANIAQALQHIRPTGIDLSSGLERSPGDKDLAKVQQLFAALRAVHPASIQSQNWHKGSPDSINASR